MACLTKRATHEKRRLDESYKSKSIGIWVLFIFNMNVHMEGSMHDNHHWQSVTSFLSPFLFVVFSETVIGDSVFRFPCALWWEEGETLVVEASMCVRLVILLLAVPSHFQHLMAPHLFLVFNLRTWMIRSHEWWRRAMKKGEGMTAASLVHKSCFSVQELFFVFHQFRFESVLMGSFWWGSKIVLFSSRAVFCISW